MKKSDLQYGMVVETREGCRYLYHYQNKYKFLNLDCDGFLWTDGFDENLKFNDDDLNEFDIMEVYKDYTCKELLWERKDPKLTEDEKVILKNIPKEYKWIARDEGGELWVYQMKPIKRKNVETWDYSIEEIDSGKFCNEDLSCFAHLFQFIKWEDEEPYLIEDLLKERGNN